MRQSTRHGSAWKVGCPGQVQCGRVNFPFTFGVYAAPVRWSMRPWESVRRASRSAGTATVGWILRGPGFARTVSPGATLLLTPNARTGLPLRSKRACSKPRARAGPVDDPSLEDWWRPRAVAGRAVAARRQDGLPPRSKRPCSKARARAGPVDDRTSRVLPATGRRGKSCDGQTPGPGCRRARSGRARNLVLGPVPSMIGPRESFRPRAVAGKAVTAKRQDRAAAALEAVMLEASCSGRSRR
jgi:hypothetical protein